MERKFHPGHTRFKEENLNNLIRGRIVENLVEEMFRELGFFTLRTGQERLVSPITQLERFYSFETPPELKAYRINLGKEDEISPFTFVRDLPDLVVLKGDKRPDLIEIKFRVDAMLFEKDFRLFEVYPLLSLLVVNVFISPNFFKKYKMKSDLNIPLAKTRFHIWVPGKYLQGVPENVPKHPFPVPLKDFLELKYEIDASEPIKKYEALIEYWLRKKPKPGETISDQTEIGDYCNEL